MFDTMPSREAARALACAHDVAINHPHAPQIMRALVSWTYDTFRHEKDATVDDVIRHLDTTDCAACHAPPGLMADADLWAKVPEWGPEIDAALEDYEEGIGEAWKPEGGLTIGAMVWFAVEWWAAELSGILEHRREEIRRADEPSQKAPEHNGECLPQYAVGDRLILCEGDPSTEYYGMKVGKTYTVEKVTGPFVHLKNVEGGWYAFRFVKSPG